VIRRGRAHTPADESDHLHHRLLRARASGQAAAAPPSSVMNSRRFV
jgi:hypothetical protein